MAKPVHQIGRIRQKVREVANIRAGFGKTEAMLLEGVNDLLGGGVSLQELRDASEWNLKEMFLRSQYIEELDQTLWFITAGGIAKENIK